MSDVLTRIDETLTYYSAGLGEDVTVPVEQPGRLVIAGVDVSEFLLDDMPRVWTPAPREAVHEWLRLHGFVATVPVDAEIVRLLARLGLKRAASIERAASRGRWTRGRAEARHRHVTYSRRLRARRRRT